MSSRRIGSFVNLSPIQDISINAFSSFNSDSVNKLTRIVSNEKDGVVFGLNVGNSNHSRSVVMSSNILKNTTIRIQDITECCVRNYNYEYNLSNLNLSGTTNKNVQGILHFNFKLVSGSPKKIVCYLNKDSSDIEYPQAKRTNENEKYVDVHLDVYHNFYFDKSDIINFGLNFVLDPEDVYSTHRVQQTYYTGQSDVLVKDLRVDLDITSDKEIEYGISGDSLDYNFPTSYVHPTHKLYITPGIAI